MKKKTIILTLIPFILIGSIIFIIVNSIYGNPVSKLLVKLSSQKYIKENFDDSDLYIDRVGYNFKFSKYYAHVVSKSSIDTYFFIYSDGLGRIKSDDYDYMVTSGYNTSMRLDTDYRQLVDSVFDAEDFPYKSDIAYGQLLIDRPTDYNQKIYNLKMSDLELDKEYDIRELGKKYGHLVIYVDSEEISEEKSAEILIDIKNRLDQEDVPFYSINFTLQQPRDPEADGMRPGDPIVIIYFLAEDIYEDGMVERVHEAHAATDAYYNELDKEKELEKEKAMKESESLKEKEKDEEKAKEGN